MAKFEVIINVQSNLATTIEAKTFRVRDNGHLVFFNEETFKTTDYRTHLSVDKIRDVEVSAFAPGSWKIITMVQADAT